MDWIKGWIIFGVGLLLFGCATTQDVQILDGEIYKIQSQIDLTRKEKDSIKHELERFQKETQKNISTLQNETQRFKADLLLRLENLQSEIRILSTGIEEYKELLKKPSKEIDRVKDDIEIRLRILEEKGRASEEKNRAQGDVFKEIENRLKGLEGKVNGLTLKQKEVEKPQPATEITSELKGVSARAGDLYKDAYETFQKGDLEGARRKFEAFLKQYPNTELSDNAQFWIGETFYQKKDFEKAILEYEKAIVKYPEGDKIPAALLKQALAFLELGDKANAKNILKRVIERYPHSDQAEVAKKKLEVIK